MLHDVYNLNSRACQTTASCPSEHTCSSVCTGIMLRLYLLLQRRVPGWGSAWIPVDTCTDAQREHCRSRELCSNDDKCTLRSPRCKLFASWTATRRVAEHCATAAHCTTADSAHDQLLQHSPGRFQTVQASPGHCTCGSVAGVLSRHDVAAAFVFVGLLHAAAILSSQHQDQMHA